MKTDKRVVIGYLAIGSLMTMGVYHLIKKQKNKTKPNNIITLQNIKANDSMNYDDTLDIKPIDPEKRAYSILR